MDRRSFTLGALATGGLLTANAQARESCTPGNRWTPPVCTAEVSFNRIVYAAQRQSFWCWAAAAEMIFALYGYRMPQSSIVSLVYGSPQNRPSGPTTNISGLLNRDWIDADGRRFRCRLSGLYDAHLGINQLNNNQIIAALRNERPLFYCNRSHAMVQTSIVYSSTPMGQQVINVGLIDPWPGIGPRGASPREIVAAQMGGDMTYLGLPSISRL